MNLWGSGHPAADAQNPGPFCGRAGNLRRRARGGGGGGAESEAREGPPGRRERGVGGRSRHPLRVPVMQMQTREGWAGMGAGGEAAESGSGRARVCVKVSRVMDAPQRSRRGQRPPGGAARKAQQGRVGRRASSSAVRHSAGKAPQRPGAPRGSKDRASFKAPQQGCPDGLLSQ